MKIIGAVTSIENIEIIMDIHKLLYNETLQSYLRLPKIMKAKTVPRHISCSEIYFTDPSFFFKNLLRVS